MFLAKAVQEAVPLAVQRIDLERLVVGVHDGDLLVDALDAQRLELKECHRARGVLEEDLVHANLDLSARAAPVPRDEVRVDELLGEAQAHFRPRRVL